MKYDFQGPLLLTTVLFLTVEQSLTPSPGNAEAGTTVMSDVEKSRLKDGPGLLTAPPAGGWGWGGHYIPATQGEHLVYQRGSELGFPVTATKFTQIKYCEVLRTK